ncbi:hypothetical protein SANA_22790 [Gottschalkiaceae bacterium SANA]|nr:hypothetical protein SANA_22790 [Gottschalkiaceae bacterium SANA]
MIGGTNVAAGRGIDWSALTPLNKMIVEIANTTKNLWYSYTETITGAGYLTNIIAHADGGSDGSKEARVSFSVDGGASTSEVLSSYKYSGTYGGQGGVLPLFIRFNTSIVITYRFKNSVARNRGYTALLE